MSSLLEVLGDVLSGLMSGHPAKSKAMRWLERAIILLVAFLIALVLYRLYST